MKFAPIIAFAAALWTGSAVAADLSILDSGLGLRLNTSVTVTDDVVRLGDLFSGDLSRPDKAVAQAPQPGQRVILTAEWLGNVARTYGLDWHPSNAYDRASVYRPGQVISQDDILSAVRAELISKGMPANFGVAPALTLQSMTVAASSTTDIAVREAFYDQAAKVFSVVVEVPAGSPDAQFVPLRGTAFPVVTVPVLKESAGRNTLITAEMLATRDVPEEQAHRETVVDASYLIGKSPVAFIKAGQPIAEADVALVRLVEVPVLRDGLNRGATVTAADITWQTKDADGLPTDVVMAAELLVGKTARRYLTAGAILRAGDVEVVSEVEIPVAVRNINRGETIRAEDINWITANENNITGRVVTNEDTVIGKSARRSIRAGAPFRENDLESPEIVAKGKLVTIIMSTPVMTLTARGKALDAGGAADVIRIENTKSGSVILAEIVDTNTVRLTTAPQTAMQ